MVEIPSNDLILSHLVSFLHTRTWISIQFPFVKFCFWRIVRVVSYCELFLFNTLCSRSVLFLSIYLRNKISLTFLKPAFNHSTYIIYWAAKVKQINGIWYTVKPVYKGHSRETENVSFKIEVKIIGTIHKWQKTMKILTEILKIPKG
jgi:hypothetical protein